MSHARRQIIVQMADWSDGAVRLFFPATDEDKRFSDNDGRGACTYGIVAFETLLQSTYPQIDFQLERGVYQEDSSNGFIDYLHIKGELHALCAVNVLCTSTVFVPARISFSFESLRNKLAATVRKRILDGESDELEEAMAKPIILSRYKEVYETLKRNINTVFIKQALIVPSFIQDAIVEINEFHDADLEIAVPKFVMLMNKIDQQRQQLLTGAGRFGNFKYRKIINAYEEILKQAGLNDEQKRHEYVTYYKKYEGQLNDALYKAAAIRHFIPKEKIKHSARVRIFLDKIQILRFYGEILEGRQVKKGTKIIELADELSTYADTYFNQTDKEITAGFQQFKQRFTAMLSSKDSDMGKYRFALGTIIANLLIALTGIGLIVLAGKLIYSKVKDGYPLFFGQEKLTTSELKIKSIEASLGKISLST